VNINSIHQHIDEFFILCLTLNITTPIKWHREPAQLSRYGLEGQGLIPGIGKAGSGARLASCAIGTGDYFLRDKAAEA
jgi:hypothetical protein